MKNITTWAAASAVIAILGACTTEVTDGTSDGGTTSTSAAGAGGSAGSSTTTAGGGGAGTGGSGGSSSDDAGVCMAKSDDSACRKCALSQCMTELCACEGNSGCGGQVGKYLECLSKATSTSEEDSCSTTFATDSNTGGGAGPANDLGSCMTTDTNCASICEGKDGGVPRRRP
jgi:hypothetical protein